jgi:hypothetical protein
VFRTAGNPQLKTNERKPKYIFANTKPNIVVDKVEQIGRTNILLEITELNM